MQLEVWNDSVELYIQSIKLLSNFPFELKKTAGNAIDAAHSISRNIAEGYCRKSTKEYLSFLNYALGSSGEYISSIYTFYRAKQISEEDYFKIEAFHYHLDNRLLRLIKSLAKKM